MIENTLYNQIEEAVPGLLRMAKEMTWNKLSRNCKFILTEIIESQENFHLQRQMRKQGNDKKISVTLPELMPTLHSLYNDLYDINLYIYRATKRVTIIDIRYYLKSSLDKNYRQEVLHKPPTLHCKVSLPPWVSGKKKKFDINWELNEGMNKLRFFWNKFKSDNSK